MLEVSRVNTDFCFGSELCFGSSRKRNFGISYLSRDRGGVEVYVSLLSDWDLDAAFVSAAKPFLQLKVDIKPSEDSK